MNILLFVMDLILLQSNYFEESRNFYYIYGFYNIWIKGNTYIFKNHES